MSSPANQNASVGGANQVAKKRQKKMLWGVAGALFLTSVGGLFLFGPKKPPEPPEKVRETAISTPGGKHSDQELWRSQSEGMLRNINDRLAKMEADGKQKDEQIRDFQTKLSQTEKSHEAGQGGMSMINDDGLLDQPLPLAKTKQPPLPNGKLSANHSTIEEANTTPQRQLITVGYQMAPHETATANAGEGAAREGKPNFAQTLTEKPLLTSASFVRAVMLSGLDAPTGGQASSDPLPVFFRLIDKAVLPNRMRAQVKECHAYGVGWGHLQSERAHIRLETLSCILKNGQHIDTAIKGHVIGEDGKVGVRGRLVSKQGQMIANGIMAGLASGIGQGFASKFNTISTGAAGTVATISGDAIWKSGIGQGVGNGMDMLAQYYIRAAENLYPVIEVDSARTVELAFTRPLHIKGFSEEDYSALVNRNRGLR